MPCKSLFVEINDELWAFLTSELRGNQHSLVTVFPLNQKSKLTIHICCTNYLFRLKPCFEWSLFVLCFCICFILLSLLGFWLFSGGCRRFLFRVLVIGVIRWRLFSSGSWVLSSLCLFLGLYITFRLRFTRSSRLFLLFLLFVILLLWARGGTIIRAVT